jgi:protein ImuA
MLPESLPPGLAGASVRLGSAPCPPLRAASPLDAAEPGRLHELFAQGAADAPALAAAALLMAGQGPGPLVWLRTEAAERRGGRLYGPGLAALGLDPARLLLGVLADELALLKAAVELLRAGAVGALLLELHGAAPRLDLTASRRLALAAAAGATPCLLLRVGGAPVPSAAWRRWTVKAGASVPLPGRAPGAPVFALELTRSRSGPAGAGWRLEWRPGCWAPLAPCEEDDDAKPFPSLARASLSLPAGGPADAGWRRAG